MHESAVVHLLLLLNSYILVVKHDRYMCLFSQRRHNRIPLYCSMQFGINALFRFTHFLRTI